MSVDLVLFLAHQFPRSSFRGRIQVGCRGPWSSGVVPALTCDYDCLSSSLDSFSFSSRCDYYLSANAVSGVQRCIASLFSLHNLVIDLDCHGDLSFFSCEELVDSLLWRLEHSVFSVVMPMPTALVRTGRGLQLWWGIVGVSAKLKPFYDELMDYYISCLSPILLAGCLEDFSMFTVDTGASKNAVGYFRMPATWNTKSNSFVTYTLMADTYDLMGLFHEMKRLVEEEVVLESTSQEETRSLSSGGDYVELAHSRVHLYEQLRDLRFASIGNEERNNFCFMVYNAFAPCYGHDVAYKKMREFNKGFKKPMKVAELKTVISSAKRKGGYHYSMEKIMQFLHITEEEMDALHVVSYESAYLTKKKQKVVRNLTKKEMRNDTLLALYDAGNSAQSIAEELGLSVPTVANVLKSNGRSHKLSRKEEILSLQKEGKSNAEIAQICKCSMRTVQRAVLV